MNKLRYSIRTRTGKIKSYVDKSWCYCADYPEPHKHEAKRDGGVSHVPNKGE